MGWLRGSTDYTNIRADLYNLLTGAAASSARGSGQTGNGITLSAGDQWTGIDATNYVIRSKATMKIPRGEIKSWRGMPRFVAADSTAGGYTTVTATTMGIGTPTFSGAYSGGTARVYYTARVSTVNTVPGVLTGTVVTYSVINADTGATVTSNTTVSGWAAATTDTKLLNNGVSLTLTLGTLDQFTANRVYWVRGYSTTYPQGVDYIPEAARINTGNTIVLSNASGGSNTYTQTTDYKVVQQADWYPSPADNVATQIYVTEWAGEGVFSGIEWQAGGAPPAAGTAYYLVDCDIYQAYLWLGGTYQNYLCIMPVEFWDGSQQRFRNYRGNVTAPTSLPIAAGSGQSPVWMLVPLFSSTTPTGSWFVNYWISVKNDKIVCLLRGDIGNTGYENIWTFQNSTPTQTADKWPWVWAASTNANPALAPACSQLYYDKPYWGTYDLGSATGSRGAIYPYNSSGVTTEGMPFYAMNAATEVNPNGIDRQWYLYTIYWDGAVNNKDSGGTYTATARRSGLRGKFRGLWLLANDNYANLDELVDGANTYLLTLNTNGFCGDGTLLRFAILEE